MAGISLWNRCNNKCIMCTNPPDFQLKENSKNYQFDKIIFKIKNFENLALFRAGKDNLTLTGGEPTLHPNFLEILTWIRHNFPRSNVVLLTNGRMFYYKDFTKKVLSFPNLTIEVSLHGSKSIHDKITRTKGSFKQTVSGIQNLLKYLKPSQKVGIRTVILKQNYKHLNDIFCLITQKFPLISQVVLIFPEYEGLCKFAFSRVKITYREIQKEIIQVVKKWQDKVPEIRLYHFPLCALPFELWRFAWRTLGEDEVTFLPKCDGCLYKNYCLGIHKEYVKMVGEKEFMPIKNRVVIQPGESFYHPISGVF